MTKEDFDMFGIAAQCRRPDPWICYERRVLRQAMGGSEEPEAELCPGCPVASWLAAMMLAEESAASRSWPF